MKTTMPTENGKEDTAPTKASMNTFYGAQSYKAIIDSAKVDARRFIYKTTSFNEQ
jgi:hypothetical protein